MRSGLLVESHAGRPTKVEGNPDHPASLGATDIFHQASVLTLYDPDRSQTVTHLGQTRTWGEAWPAIREAMQKQREQRGAGLRLLTETIVSPTLAGQIENLLEGPARGQMARLRADPPRYGLARGPDGVWRGGQPGLRFPQGRRGALAGRRLLAVRSRQPPLRGRLHGPAAGADHAAGCRTARMNRLYVVETAVSCTGAKADHRLALRAGEIEGLARAVATKLGVAAAAAVSRLKAALRDPSRKMGRRGGQGPRGQSRSLPGLAGDRQPPVVHLLAHVLNEHLGNVGQTVTYTAPTDARPGDRTQSLRELVQDMEQGRVEFLVILGGNPVYTAPADLNFVEHLQKVPLRIHHGLFVDETSYQCHWHLPEAHYLEAWSDAQAYDGTASIVQPLDRAAVPRPSAHEVLALLANLQETPGREIVRTHWRKRWEASARGRHFRAVLGAGPARRRDSRHGLPAQAGQAQGRLAEAACSPARTRHKLLPRRARGRTWRSCFSRTRRSTTARGPITAGSRNCPSRSRSSPGATPPS